MGEIDIKTNEYMRDNAHFADAFNYFCFDGRQLIKSEELRELDRSAVAIPFGDEKNTEDNIQKYRDVFKISSVKQDDKRTYLLLGIEDQTHINYAMPVRNMIYDALAYGRQVEDIAKNHRKSGEYGNTSDEYLSGFHKEDKLKPVVTLVIYWSPGKWDGPLSLHEMFSDEDPGILKGVPDYRINLLTPQAIQDSDFDKFQTRLGEALQFIKYSKDKDNLSRAVNNNPDFQHLDRRTVELINAVTNANLEIPEGKEEINVCTAINDMKKESYNEGRNRGNDDSKIEDIRKVMKKLQYTAQQAMDFLDIPEEIQKKYLGML